MTEISLAPVQLVDHEVILLHCEMNPAYSGGDGDDDAAYAFNLQCSSEPVVERPLARLFLSVHYDGSSNEGCRYKSVRIVLSGVIAIHPSVPTEAVTAYALPSGHSMLYGVARALVAMITRSFPGGVMNLPAVNAQNFLLDPAPQVKEAGSQALENHAPPSS